MDYGKMTPLLVKAIQDQQAQIQQQQLQIDALLKQNAEMMSALNALKKQ